MSPLALPPGLEPEPAALLDERVRPDFRDVFGRLTADATTIRTAVTRVRLSTLDLGAAELARVRRFRVVVAELNALHLDAEARVLLTRPARAAGVRLLAGLLERGILEVRSAPLGGWSPDFTVFSGEDGPTAALLGFHWFERPFPHRGPALGSLHGPAGARRAARRHDELWERAHDVGPAIWSLLARADARARRMEGPPETPRSPLDGQGSGARRSGLAEPGRGGHAAPSPGARGGPRRAPEEAAS